MLEFVEPLYFSFCVGLEQKTRPIYACPSDAASPKGMFLCSVLYLVLADFKSRDKKGLGRRGLIPDRGKLLSRPTARPTRLSVELVSGVGSHV
jgi:hypothetical protein